MAQACVAVDSGLAAVTDKALNCIGTTRGRLVNGTVSLQRSITIVSCTQKLIQAYFAIDKASGASFVF